MSTWLQFIILMQKDLSDWIDVRIVEIDDNISKEISASFDQK